MVFAISVSPIIDETKLLLVSAIQREGCTYKVTTQAEQKNQREVVYQAEQ
jgi:hypothetical protein